MQGHITLSKTEKQYQFLYLILMLLAALIFLGVIFLKDSRLLFRMKMSSPFKILRKKQDSIKNKNTATK